MGIGDCELWINESLRDVKIMKNNAIKTKSFAFALKIVKLYQSLIADKRNQWNDLLARATIPF